MGKAVYVFIASTPPPLSPVAKKRADYHLFLIFRNSISPHEMERSLRVKMFDIDLFGRF